MLLSSWATFISKQYLVYFGGGTGVKHTSNQLVPKHLAVLHLIFGKNPTQLILIAKFINWYI